MRDIETLSGFGDRRDGSESYAAAAEWLENRLADAGYAVEHHGFMHGLQYRQNIFATKVGAVSPEKMYILSAHLDGLGGGGAADDDASGVALVLQAAEAFASPRIQTDITIRFIFWNTEEMGLEGSRAYVADRADLQGKEDPPGSGLYPEPHWLGMIQHDMILFDHGQPPGPSQSPDADLDIEYRDFSAFAEQSRALAATWQASNATYSSDYPAEVGGGMRGTDSVAFQDHTAAISIRENTRSELLSGGNPNWHRSTDAYETYSEQDFRLGFNALQMSVGAVVDLAQASLMAAR